MPERAILVNFYQFLHELIRTRALWRIFFPKILSPIEIIQKCTVALLTCLTSKLSNMLAQIHAQILENYTYLKLPYPTLVCNTPGSLTEAWSQIGKLFFWESVKFYIKLRQNVYENPLWNTPACHVIIVCFTAKSIQCPGHNISWKPEI